ncbi:MAG TPA: Hpt domain-containing protein, partial [Lacipirellulaceae bacterium]|nr:Hpt domain-containing protein [Lacipirellulaceae bacterium]
MNPSSAGRPDPVNSGRTPCGRDAGTLTNVVDVAAALRRMGNDWELFDEIVAITLEDAPQLVHAAREALAQGNAAEVRRAGHSLKSLMATLGATSATNAARALEQCGAGGELSAASP